MAFIEYGARKPGLRPSSVRITKSHIFLSQDLMENIQGADGVILAYDPDKQMIRIKPSKDGGIKNKDGAINAKGFCKFFNLNKKGVFDAKWDAKDKAIYVNLNGGEES